MIRNVTLESGRFKVTDDPYYVIGNTLNFIVNNRNRWPIHERLAPDGDGFTLDTVGTVSRLYTRDDLPEPWDDDQTLDPEKTELWALYRDPDRSDPYIRRTMIIHGVELRALVAEALRLCNESEMPVHRP